jgi:hypothetical protein
MKKFVKFILFGIFAVAIVAFAMFNVGLNTNSSISKLGKANLEALTQENQSDWHSGECHTWTSQNYLTHLPVDVLGYVINDVYMIAIVKQCEPGSGASCLYGTKFYYLSSGNYIAGSYNIQYCQG